MFLFSVDSFRPLGMTSGAIPNYAITASSTFKGRPVYRSRLYWTKNGNLEAWITGTNNLKQWLKIDLMRKEFITAVATQSRHNYGQWVKSYGLSYGTDGMIWNECKANDGTRKVSRNNKHDLLQISKPV